MNHCFARRSKQNFGFSVPPRDVGCVPLPNKNYCLNAFILLSYLR
ncbi:hypothetical protein V1280_000045 [Bradyrhizobium sp. AZCC 2230]